MISKECKFSEFIGAVRDKDPYEVIHLADREATEAERLFLRLKTDSVTRQHCGRQYAEQIKQLIDYMRYEVKPRVRAAGDAQLLATLNPDRRPRRGL
jgi:hypothetical protein